MQPMEEKWQKEWSNLHIKYCAEEMKDCKTWTEGIWSCSLPQFKMRGYRNEMMANYCEDTIIKAKKAYYEGEPIMDDGTYDNFEESLKSLRPESKLLQIVG